MRKTTRVAIILFILLVTIPVLAQGPIPDRTRRLFRLRQLVDLPTAGMLEPGSYAVGLRMYAGGGVLGEISVGLMKSFMFGVSYGGENMLGEGDMDWNPDPGVFVRLRLFTENIRLQPAIVVGFDSQGFGRYKPDFKRYEYKSRGLYVVTSKYYGFTRRPTANSLTLGLHLGLNWSPEGGSKDDESNLFLGADLILNTEFRVAAEYDFAVNDNENEDYFGSGNGFLNMSLQWMFAHTLVMEFSVKNILKNGATPLTREIKVGYYESIR
jgi:hypothetical protein